MEHFVIITKEEHTGICILQPTVSVKVSNRRDGIIDIEISDSSDMGAAVFCHLGCGSYQGRYIEDYDKEAQLRILDSIENAIARDIAHFAQLGYTCLGINLAQGEDPEECFFLEEYKAKWQKDYLCILDLFQQESSKCAIDKSKTSK